MRIVIPDYSLVVLVDPAGALAAAFAGRHFSDAEIVSSDRGRASVSSGEAAPCETDEVPDALVEAVAARLERRELAVVSTDLPPEGRACWIRVARRHHAPPIAIVFDFDPSEIRRTSREGMSRRYRQELARQQSRQLRGSLRALRKEGFRKAYILSDAAEAEAAQFVREPLASDLRNDHGPFDIVGDVHGCFDELSELLDRLGYRIDAFDPGSEELFGARHPGGRTAIFVGDLVDRGPRSKDCLRLVAGMCESGSARCVVGNHDFKLAKWLRGRRVKLTNGLDRTVAELEPTSEGFRRRMADFVQGLLSHCWLADGDLVVAHGGLKEAMHGGDSAKLRAFSLYGETTGEKDEHGLHVRLDWARDYRGRAEVVYGHTPVLGTGWVNRTLCIDTACVFGGHLTALRWPEREMVSVPARRRYADPPRPLAYRHGSSAP